MNPEFSGKHKSERWGHAILFNKGFALRIFNQMRISRLFFDSIGTTAKKAAGLSIYSLSLFRYDPRLREDDGSLFEITGYPDLQAP